MLIQSRMVVDAVPQMVWNVAGRYRHLSRATSKLLYSSIKNQRLNHPTVDISKIHGYPDWAPDLLLAGAGGDSPLEPINFLNLWKIKNPSLRGYRFKILVKDVFSNERRHKFGISESPLCEVCNAVESVCHQLFECPNAIRIWSLYPLITGKRIASFREIIVCTADAYSEIIKSVLIKRLLQIDRSRSLDLKSIAIECLFFLKIEKLVLSNCNTSHNLDNFISNLQDQIQRM